MGPVLIFDKSFLQSLNVDESVLLDLLFLTNITPLFFIETLADIEKEIKDGRSPEEVVGNLAYKTPEWGKINVFHKTLLEGELSGKIKVDMKYGRPHISGGKRLELDGKKGVYYQASPEEEAMSRWARNEFLDVERLYAKSWRKSLSDLNLNSAYNIFQHFFYFTGGGKPKNLKEVKDLVDEFINEFPDREYIFRYGLTLIGVSDKFQDAIIERWKKDNRPSISSFAPYFKYVFSIDLFFYIALASDLISRVKSSNKVDFAYLYYLPFCMVFTSNDKLHSNVVPLFLRDNQSFISGIKLKEDLAKLDKYYDSFSEEEKRRGLFSLASQPPDDTSYLITRLWDRHMSPGWRENKNSKPSQRAKSQVMDKLISEMRRVENKGVRFDKGDFSSKEVDYMVIKRKVRARKGKWTIFPPEVIKASKSKSE